MGDNALSPTYCREAEHGRQPTVAHVMQRGSTWATTHCRPRTAERQYMGDNPLSPTYCREAVHGRQPTVTHVLQRGSTWATTHCSPTYCREAVHGRQPTVTHSWHLKGEEIRGGNPYKQDLKADSQF
ncbi:hypothetical protein PoB_006385300 [Plakobranchus ocellatus]|uniref:Uncharacterized protein n=1 Tax=Plakobranchus ocellatus TaxID=259542 RepID=A0AAV4CZI6_9GAST|nr:hypothetical protein PoB_006385300 [Plakobranchus ocellatus]